MARRGEALGWLQLAGRHLGCSCGCGSCTMPVLCGERLVRNHGPFPYIQSEGCWKPLRTTASVHVPVCRLHSVVCTVSSAQCRLLAQPNMAA